MKDNFSTGSEAYAQFRPHYPDELFTYLLSLVKNKASALDCGTGNGQVAGVLADHFTEVYAIDISAQQLKAAMQKTNIFYSVQRAEETSFQKNQFDLITVAQAIHWFRFADFYAEVRRMLKPGGVFAIIGYGLLRTEKKLQDLIDHFYKNSIGPYWDPERHYIDEAYQTIPFPFEEINAPDFKMEYNWSFEQLVGYLNTWSAVKHYQKQNHENPVDRIVQDLKEAWDGSEKTAFVFPVFFRVGKVKEQ